MVPCIGFITMGKETKISPGKKKKAEILFSNGFTDLQVSRALHIGISLVKNLRSSSNDIGNSEELPQESERGGNENPSRNPDLEKRSESNDFNGSESQRSETGSINFVGGKPMGKKEDKKEDNDQNECGSCGTKFSGTPKHCPGCGLEFEEE